MAKKNRMENPNPNPTKKQQEELHILAGLYNVCHYLFKGIMQIDVLGKRNYTPKPTAKAYIDASKKQVRTTVPGHGGMKVDDEHVNFEGYVRIIEKLPDSDKK